MTEMWYGCFTMFIEPLEQRRMMSSVAEIRLVVPIPDCVPTKHQLHQIVKYDRVFTGEIEAFAYSINDQILAAGPITSGQIQFVAEEFAPVWGEFISFIGS